MPTYNAQTSRADVAGIIPTEYSNELLNGTVEQSNVLRLARRLRRMTRKEERLPVLSALPVATFRTGDTGLSQTTEANWTDRIITAEPLDVLIPIPRDVLSDANIPLWSEIMPVAQEACGTAIDNAVLYAINAPATWPGGIALEAIAASNYVVEGTGTDLYDDLLGAGGVFAKVETDGFSVDGCIAHLTMKGKLRGVRDANGIPVFNRDPVTAAQYLLDGSPINFPKNGAGSTDYPLVAGAWREMVYSVREDASFEIFREGIIQDAAGNIVYNLMQQHMYAMMLTIRLGFAVANRVNRTNTDPDTRYPWAVLTAVAP